MLDLNLLEHFNSYYKENTENFYSKSLRDFFAIEISKRLPGTHLKILEVGCGNFSLFEDLNVSSDVLAIDISTFGIQSAKKNQKNKCIEYKVLDVSAGERLFEADSFDFILDAHALHCITDKEQRSRAFKNIYHSLNPHGLFAGEMMIANKSQVKGGDSFKYIPDAFDLENEILSHGFKIKYFMVVRDLEFVSGNTSSDLLRVICSK